MKDEENKVTIRFTRGEFLWFEISQDVFSWAEDDFGPLDGRYQLFVAVSEAVINPIACKIAYHPVCDKVNENVSKKKTPQTLTLEKNVRYYLARSWENALSARMKKVVK